MRGRMELQESERQSCSGGSSDPFFQQRRRIG